MTGATDRDRESRRSKQQQDFRRVLTRAERVRVDPAEVEQRLAEREQREAADTRTEVQRWLNDPPADHSALAAKR